MRLRLSRAVGSLVLACAAAGTPVLAAAQGTLSTQGFGYPPGQISAGAAALGGGPAETDGSSALNPAALGAWFRPGVYFEYAPEFRSVTANGVSDHTTTSRFPLAVGAIQFGNRVTLGVSLSTLLDRTWATARSGYQYVGRDSIPFTETFESAGAINDVKAGVSVGVLRNLWVGVAADVFSGDNDLTITRSSSDTSEARYTQTARISYSGVGASAGLMWEPGSMLAIGLSGRIGGDMKSLRGDTVLSRASAPDRAGAGVTFTGLPGIVLAVHADWNGWTRMNSLGSPTLGITNTWDYGGGAEFHGPRAFGAPVALRVGYRTRGLPFLVDSAKIRETAYSGGVGFVLAQGRSRLDLTLVRAIRSGVPGVTEHAWTMDFGILVRP